MFQKLTKTLTLAAFFAHGLLGCCWHHQHSDAMSHTGPVVRTESLHVHGGHDVTQCGSDIPAGATNQRGYQHQDSEAPHHSECHEAHCVFTRTQDNVSASADVLTANVTSLIAVDSPHMPSPSDLVSPTFAALNEPAFLFAAPLHARCQVWTI